MFRPQTKKQITLFLKYVEVFLSTVHPNHWSVLMRAHEFCEDVQSELPSQFS